MQTSVKVGFAQVSLTAQKIYVTQILGEGVAPGSPTPSGQYTYVLRTSLPWMWW